MRTSSRNLAVLLFDEVDVLDVAGPLQVFTLVGRMWNWRPFRVCPVSEQTGLVQTRNQISLEARFELSDCPEPEVVLVPGGYGARTVGGSSVEWLRAHSAAADVVISVGNGVVPLARAGLLSGVEICTPKDIEEQLRELEPNAKIVANQRVVQSGKVMTANASASGIDVALTAVAKLFGPKLALGVAKTLDYAWGLDGGAPAPTKIEIR